MRTLLALILVIFVFSAYANKPDGVRDFLQTNREKNKFWFISCYASNNILEFFFWDNKMKAKVLIGIEQYKAFYDYHEFYQSVRSIQLWTSDSAHNTYAWFKDSFSEQDFESHIYPNHIDLRKPVFDHKNKLSISLMDVNDLKLVSEENDWFIFKGKYNLKGVPSPLPEEHGDVVVLVSSERMRMREVYSINGKWGFVKHLEIDEIEPDLSHDPNALLKYVWRKYQSALRPLIVQMEDRPFKMIKYPSVTEDEFH